MKDNKLISMVEFVLENQKNRTEDWRHKEGYHSECNTAMLVNVYNYANFLKQPLTLGMFVPCDLEGNVLKHPDTYKESEMYCTHEGLDIYREKYQQAKERVLFEGFEMTQNPFPCQDFYTIESSTFSIQYHSKDNHLNTFTFKTIEDLIDRDLTLTPNALKQIG